MTESTGIYIHIPFCASKCAYCDFVSFAGRENRISSYFEALLNEINSYDFSGAVNSVYIGGGTPSFVDEKYIARLMSALGKRFSLAEDCEISVESNPNSLTYGKLLSFKNCGINRLSMGVQSADDSVLKLIGRTHNQADSLKALEAIHRAGMVNFNLDIMFSLPGQSIASFRDSLKFAMESGAKHISCYGLSVEENTPLYDLYEKGVFSQNDETDRIMYHTAADMLSGAGFERYEISNFARAGYECRHNKDCWDFCDYIGFGTAAHSFTKGERYANTADMDKYINFWKKGISSRESAVEGGISERTVESIEELMGDYNMVALRKSEGIDTVDFARRFGVDFYEKYAQVILQMAKEGLITDNKGKIALSSRGYDFASRVMEGFI